VSEQTITAQQFGRRLAALLTSGRLSGLPRKVADRRILLKASALALPRDGELSETEVNLALTDWLEGPARTMGLDHVTLRRELVDAGYLRRDDEGRRYLPGGAAAGESFFAPEVDDLDPRRILEEARELKERRRREHLSGG